MTIAWPDIVIAIVVLVTTLKGLKRGMVAELTGALALAFGVAAAFAYSGNFDGFVRSHGHLGPGPAHVVGIILYAILAYAIVYVLGTALSTIAKLPLLNIANTILGAVVGLAKGIVYCWVILFFVQLFPLPHDVRGDLHRSELVRTIDAPSAWLDDRLRSSLPDAMKPYGDQIFERRNT